LKTPWLKRHGQKKRGRKKVVGAIQRGNGMKEVLGSKKSWGKGGGRDFQGKKMRTSFVHLEKPRFRLFRGEKGASLRKKKTRGGPKTGG